MIKRVLTFNKQDWKHLKWLTGGMFTDLFVKYNWHDVKEAYYFIKIHLMYDSRKVE